MEDFIKTDIETNDFWDDLPEQVQKLIKKSQAQSDRDMVIPHEPVMAKVRQMLNRHSNLK